MKKFILIGLGALALGLGALALFRKPGAVEIPNTDVKGLGNRYETKVDLVVFQYRDSDDYFVRVPGNDAPEIKDIPAKLPYRWYDYKVFGVLPAGSRFQIVGGKQSTSTTMGGSWYMVNIESDGKFRGHQIATPSIESHADGQAFDSKYAIELTTPTAK
jgi:hypothetical protein